MIYDLGIYGFLLIRTGKGMFISAVRLGGTLNEKDITLETMMHSGIGLSKEELHEMGGTFEQEVPTAWIEFIKIAGDVGQTTKDVYWMIAEKAEQLKKRWMADKIVGIVWIEPKPDASYDTGLPPIIKEIHNQGKREEQK